MAPIIIATDKTQLTQFSGDKAAYPVYLTLGNIPRSIRRKPSMHACVLIGYLSVEKIEGEGLTADEKQARGQRLFHDSMRLIFEPLIEAGENGVEVACGDGWVRRVYPLLAAYVADYPEQCLVTCTKGNMCPKCQRSAKDLHLSEPGLPRLPEWTINIMDQARRTSKTRGQYFTATQEAGLSGGVYRPFWQDFPYCDIHLSITPDVLHQLYQGVFRHIVDWCTLLLGPKELDRRIRCLPPCYGTRHFKKGISALSQISGTERKDMAKILLACLIGKVSLRAIIAIRSLLDFIYLAQYPTHSEETLGYMKDALREFEGHKDIFIQLKIRSDLNIPKFHSLLHYIQSIRLFGTTDNYNTEMFERLHIDYAKEAWRSTNHRDERPQMILWLERHEKMARYEHYLKHILPHKFPPDPTPSSSSSSPRTVKLVQRAHVPYASIADVENTHNAPGFLRAIKEYLNMHAERPLSRQDLLRAPLPFETVSIYHSVSFSRYELGHTEAVPSLNVMETLKARPATGKQPARFDPIIVLDTSEAESTGVQGNYLYCYHYG